MCVVGAVNDGKCSLRWTATVSVVQESMWWKGNQIRDRITDNGFCPIIKVPHPADNLLNGVKVFLFIYLLFNFCIFLLRGTGKYDIYYNGFM